MERQILKIKEILIKYGDVIVDELYDREHAKDFSDDKKLEDKPTELNQDHVIMGVSTKDSKVILYTYAKKYEKFTYKQLKDLFDIAYIFKERIEFNQ